MEAGGEVEKDDLIPGFTKPRFGNAEGNWMYETVPQEKLGGRILPYPRGRGLGGCSYVFFPLKGFKVTRVLTKCRGNNFMAWVRGPKVDYDDWAAAVGDEFWKWDNVLPWMKRVGSES